MRIGIIGYGCVGKSVHNMLGGHEVSLYDPIKGYDDFTAILSCAATFVCVPTPTVKSEQDLEILYGILDGLVEDGYKGMVIIKSTVLPSKMRDLIGSYSELDIMHAPEFLNQFEPFFAHTRHLIGVKNIYQANLYREIFGLEGYGHKDVRTCDPVTASMAKYFNNCHGAVKVALFNEFYDICEKMGVSYREVLGCIMSTTDNIDKKYTQIGADGQRGFGGVCFPKDIVAFQKEYCGATMMGAIVANLLWRREEMDKVM